MTIFSLNIIEYYAFIIDTGNVFYMVETKVCNTGMSLLKGIMAVHVNSTN
jgi:hypothetical protein